MACRGRQHRRSAASGQGALCGGCQWLSMVSGERIGPFWQGMRRAEVMALMGYRARFSMTSTAMMAALAWCICPLSV